jgi:DinB superfamily
MKKISAQLKEILDRSMGPLQEIPEEEFAFKLSPEKWSKKEIIGHLIDSAQANIRRFVVSQYEDNPTIQYNQDQWVKIVAYQQWDAIDIIRLWSLLNVQICFILDNTDDQTAKRISTTDTSHTIEWLAEDYNKHLLHHLHVVLNLEPVAYP